MLKITIVVEGMHCGMCETHLNDVLRRVDGVNSVKSSYVNGRAEVIANDEVSANAVVQTIKSQGYGVGKVISEPYEKKGLFARLKKQRGQYSGDAVKVK